MSKLKLLSAIPLFAALALSSCTLPWQTAPTPTPTDEQEDMMEDREEMMESRMETVSVTLDTQNDSGQTGQALLREEDGRVTVTLKLSGSPVDAAQPAHIHGGSCPAPGDVVYPLTDVMNGVSETTLSVSMDDLMDQLPLAINVHKSAEEVSTYVACGDIEVTSMHMMSEDEMEEMMDDMMKDDSMMDGGMMDGGMMEEGGMMMEDKTKEDDGMMNTGY